MAGVHSFCAGGRAHHRITLRTPTAGQRRASLQLLIYDERELQDRMAMRVADSCNSGIMAQLQTMLQQYNPFVQMFKQVKEIVTMQDVNLCFMAKTGKSTPAVSPLFV